MKQLDQIILEHLEKQEEKLIRICENRFSLFESNITPLLENNEKCKCFQLEVSH